MREVYCDRCGKQYNKNYQQVISGDSFPMELSEMCNEDSLLSDIICCLLNQHDWCPECLKDILEQINELKNYYKGFKDKDLCKTCLHREGEKQCTPCTYKRDDKIMEEFENGKNETEDKKES